jgi:hypothetical protein
MGRAYWCDILQITKCVFNGCLHIMGHSRGHSMILAVDMEENTWRKIDRPSGLQHSMHQAQGDLCVCTVAGPNDSKLSI